METSISKEWQDFFRLLNYKNEKYFMEEFIKKTGMWDQYRAISSNMELINPNTGKMVNKWPENNTTKLTFIKGGRSVKIE